MTTLTNELLFTNPVHLDSAEGKALMRAVDDIANAEQRKVWVMMMTNNQMAQMTMLTKRGWKTLYTETLGQMGVKDKAVGDILRVIYRKGNKTRRGWCLAMEKSDSDKLTKEENDALTEAMRGEEAKLA